MAETPSGGDDDFPNREDETQRPWEANEEYKNNYQPGYPPKHGEILQHLEDKMDAIQKRLGRAGDSAEPDETPPRGR